MSELGKRMCSSNEGAMEPMGAGCTVLCSHLCSIGAVSLCKCKNNKVANKGSAYYSKRNSNAAVNREPSSS